MSGGGFIPTDTEFHQVYVTEPCRRCDYKFHYPEGTPWNVVNDMVNNHWSVCPGSISASMAKSRHMAADPRYSGALSVQEGLEGGSSNDENDVDAQVRRNRKKNMMDETERKKKLEEDPWALEVTPVSVRCGACTRLVSLDKRSRYYPGLWLKHREKCMEIKRLEALEHEQGDKQESTSGSPAKKRSKGEVHHDSDLNNAQSSRSSDLKEKGVQENTEDQTRSPPATEETSESRQGGQRTFEAAESFAESSNRSEDFTSPRLIGKRRRSSSGQGDPIPGAET